ncbi:hypothetical protein WN51_05837, partial [Melipona quadrifasciata]
PARQKHTSRRRLGRPLEKPVCSAATITTVIVIRASMVWFYFLAVAFRQVSACASASARERACLKTSETTRQDSTASVIVDIRRNSQTGVGCHVRSNLAILLRQVVVVYCREVSQSTVVGLDFFLYLFDCNPTVQELSVNVVTGFYSNIIFHVVRESSSQNGRENKRKQRDESLARKAEGDLFVFTFIQPDVWVEVSLMDVAHQHQDQSASSVAQHLMMRRLEVEPTPLGLDEVLRQHHYRSLRGLDRLDDGVGYEAPDGKVPIVETQSSTTKRTKPLNVAAFTHSAVNSLCERSSTNRCVSSLNKPGGSTFNVLFLR